MIPYELVIPSASRPHLLDETLRTLFLHLDQPPARVLLHDDAVFPDKQTLIAEILRERVPKTISTIFLSDSPPIFHGPSLQRLLGMVSTEYALYTQDDFETIRDLPITAALTLLDRYGLNQIRFNKRHTMDKKGREGEEFYKVEKWFDVEEWVDDENILLPTTIDPPGTRMRLPLCIADHFYFQTNLFRVAALKPVLDWWVSRGKAHGDFGEHMEVKVNNVFNGQMRHLHGDLGPEVPVLKPEDGDWNDAETRARIQKTFIWGRIGEPPFIKHLGTNPQDWALKRANRDPIPGQPPEEV
jgi:hypothetical protein